VPGREKQFDVVLDGRTVFSKESEGRFPEVDEVVSALSAG
jgi:predicted Rdx family selenoprotein